MAPNRIVLKAFKAMKAIGISENKAKPVLRKLLKLYEKIGNSLKKRIIELLLMLALRRRMLRFIFPSLSNVVSEQKKAKIVEQGENFEEEPLADVEPLRPLKRLRRGQEVPATPSRSNSSPVSGASLLRRPKLKKGSDTPCLTYNGKEPLLPIIAFTENSSLGIRDSSAGNVSMDEPVGQEPHPSQHIRSHSSLEIASSTLGEVRISLTCNSAVGSPNFHKPTLDELIELMEQRCLRSYKITDPNFSVMNVMKDVCECYWEIATNSSHESQERVSVMASLDLLRKSTAQDALLFGVLQCQLNADELRVLHDVKDIAKGQGVVIPWINEINNERLLPFHYISQNLVFQIACVNVSLYWIVDENCCSSCFGDCLSSAVVCACARQSGKYVYSSEGLLEKEFLDECISMTQDPQQQCLLNCRCCPLERSRNKGIIEPCKVHLKRNIIKECWSKCGCYIQCGNRVVQRGINCKLQAFFTPDRKGWGLRTPEKLQKVAFVCEYVGAIVTVTELYERNTKNHNCPVLLDAYWASKGVPKDEEALSLEATCYGNVARCFDANLIEIPVEIESPEHHYYYLAFFTTRDVDAFEELIWDYGIDFDDHDHLSNAFQCRCGGKFFRNMNVQVFLQVCIFALASSHMVMQTRVQIHAEYKMSWLVGLSIVEILKRYRVVSSLMKKRDEVDFSLATPLSC
ncbi:hypothetical protein Pint_33685 [Pistacia integerrima]|uniref:Uncharacterized protein n=1 Tax=Pistacia integerrima TaxID=434235 RepID=A0ACC0X5Z4_9ROSI|nr:hypothetical protein Pint_33685 [Pistacia integerrima]